MELNQKNIVVPLSSLSPDDVAILALLVVDLLQIHRPRQDDHPAIAKIGQRQAVLYGPSCEVRCSLRQ